MYKYTHVFCDLSDVLIKGVEGVEFELADYLNLPVERIRNCFFSYNFNELWLGQISEREFFYQMINQFDWNIDVSIMLKIIRNNFVKISGMRRTYEELGRKFKLVLISVNAPEWVEYLNYKFNYSNLFDGGIFYSYEIGYTKQQKECFEYILEQLGLTPEQVIYIDDSTKNINVASKIGIKGIKFKNVQQLKEDLKEVNVLFEYY